MMTMKEKETRDIRPALLALALSLGGIIYSFFRTKPVVPSLSPPSSSSSSSSVSQVVLEEDSAEHGNDCISTAPGKPEDSCLPVDSYILGLSPDGRSNCGQDGFLMPEFSELIKEFDLAAVNSCCSPPKNVETISSDSASQKEYDFVQRDVQEQEINSLRNMVTVLKERERELEIQLLEYYGLKEQEAAVMELHNRLKINNIEAKLLTLKIGSLQADNKRLEEQVSDYAKVSADLEAARATIKLLKQKLRHEAEENKQWMLSLQQRVAKLREHEHVAAVSNPDTESELQKLKDLEEEVKQLRKSNHNLLLENSELGQRLDYAQNLATSVFENKEIEAVNEENQLLKKQNEDLTKEIEQLQDDRYADAEELVYMRWINACLRYELRNYQPKVGETVARDLSKTLSPKSEEKAKQLILEYANKEGLVRRLEFDSEYLSSSEASCLTDSDDLDDSSIDNSLASKTNMSSRRRMFGGLLKLLRGQGHHNHDGQDLSVEVPTYLEDFVRRKPYDTSVYNSGVPKGGDRQTHKLRTSSVSSSRPSLESSRLSLDIHKLHFTKDLEGVQKSRDGTGSSTYRKPGLFSKDVSALQKGNKVDPELETDENSHLLKYAEALTNRHGRTAELYRRSTSSLQ